MKLKELQKLFYSAITTQDSHSIEELSKTIKTAKNLTLEESLGVYRGSVVGNLMETLSSIYPVCSRLVGEKFFDATAVSYINKFPSLSPDLGDYGAELPTFLETFPPVASLPYFPDVARLEWYYHRVFSGEDGTELDIAALGAVPEERWSELIFYLPENSFLLESNYPVHRIWQVNQEDYEGDEIVDLDEGGVKIFIWRQKYDMRLDLPNDEEWLLLKAFANQDSFGSICEGLAGGESPVDVATLLPVFVQRGWIAGFSIGSIPLNPPS